MSTPPMRTVEPVFTPWTSANSARNGTFGSNRLRLSPIRKMIAAAPMKPRNTKMPTLTSREIVMADVEPSASARRCPVHIGAAPRPTAAGVAPHRRQASRALRSGLEQGLHVLVHRCAALDEVGNARVLDGSKLVRAALVDDA